MKLLLLSFLLFISPIFADSEAQCAVHLDDCTSCLADPSCGWCSEGFCTAKKSDFCTGTVSTKVGSCPSKKIETRNHNQCHDWRNYGLRPECSICRAIPGCFACYRNLTKNKTPRGYYRCSDVETCIATNPYGNFDGGVAVDECTGPTQNTERSSGENITVGFSPFQTGNAEGEGEGEESWDAMEELMYAMNLDSGLSSDTAKRGYKQGTYQPPGLGGQSFKIVNVQPGRKRGISVEVTFYFFDHGRQYTSAQLTQNLLEGFANPFSNIGRFMAGGSLISVTGGSGLDIASSPDPDHGLTRGAIAGIVIGCILGAAVIVVLILFIVFRKKQDYPVPFRSPAAAYRP